MKRTALLVLVFEASTAAQTGPIIQPVRALDTAVAAREALGFRITRREAQAVHLERAGVTLTLRAGAPEPQALDHALELITDPLPAPAALTKAGLRCEPIAAALRARDADGWTFFLRTARDAATPAIPHLGELNPLVVEALRRYPTDGTHPYFWPKTGSWKGCTKDLEYAGEILCSGDPKGRAYCCGLTFEVFLDGWRLWCQRNARPWRIRDLDLAQARTLQSQWFGSAQDKTCVRTALVDHRLGVQITDLDTALPGDFVQLWRNGGSGHSVVFLSWLREGKQIVGLRYWSTQEATKGIGEREERFGAGPKDMDRRQFFLVRAGGR